MINYFFNAKKTVYYILYKFKTIIFSIWERSKWQAGRCVLLMIMIFRIWIIRDNNPEENILIFIILD